MLSYGLDVRGIVCFPAGVTGFVSSKTSIQVVGRFQPPSDCVPGVKGPGRECGHSYLPSFAYKDEWSCITVGVHPLCAPGQL